MLRSLLHCLAAIIVFVTANVLVASVFVVPPVVAVAGGLYVTRWMMGH